MVRKKITRTWSRRGSSKVRKVGGKVQVKKLKYRNLTDKSARKLGHKRAPGIYSSTDAGPRRHRIKKNGLGLQNIR